MEVTKTLAQFVVDSRYDAIPDKVRHEARRSVLNWLGCAIGASHHEGIDIALAALGEFSGPAQATVLGRGNRVDIMHAALLNGISSHMFDFDDTHLKTVIHPSGPVASALLALAEYRPMSGADFLHAFILGVEVECRIGNAVYPSHYDVGWHITGTAGVFGAAAAVGRVLKLNAQQMTWVPSGPRRAKRHDRRVPRIEEFHELGTWHRSAPRVRQCARDHAQLRRDHRQARADLGSRAQYLQTVRLRHRNPPDHRRLRATAQ